MKSIPLVKTFLGLVEMASGLVKFNATFSLPKWQAVKTIFFAPCLYEFQKTMRFNVKQFLKRFNSELFMYFLFMNINLIL